MEAGDSNTQTSYASQAKPIWYVLVVLTLILACTHVWMALKGKPSSPGSTMLLITLACISLSGFVSSPTVRKTLSAVGIVFALAAIYTFVR